MRLRWIAVTGRPVCDDAGVVTGMRGVLQDISEHVQFVERLRGGHFQSDRAASDTASRIATTLSDDERRDAERVQAHLAAIVDSADDGIIAKDLDGIIQSWNSAAERIFGYAPREIVGRPVRLLIPDELQVEEDEILARLRRGERIDHVETVRVRKDGCEIPVSLTVSPMRDGTGVIVGASKIVRDISAQRAAAAALAAQQAWLQATLESITDAFCALDGDWRFTYVNRQAEVLLGRSRASLIGENHWEAYPDTVGTEVERTYRRAVAEKTSLSLEYHYAPHGRWYEAHVYPSDTGLSVYFRDVSERKARDVVILESEQRFRQLADAMPQIVWTASSAGTIDYLNRRWTEFTGLPAGVSNAGWASLLHPEDAPDARARWAASTASGETFEMPVRLRDRRDDSYRWHLIRTVAVRADDGTVARWFGTATDIHQQKSAEASLRYLAEVSTELATVVDYEATLQKVARSAVPFFADWAAVDLAEPGGLRRLAVAHQDAHRVYLANELMREYPPDPEAPVGMYAVLRTGQPLIVSDISDDMLTRGAKDARHLALLRGLGLRSYICVPLMATGKIIGLLTFATAESGRLYSEDDLSLAMDLAQRASIAVENTRLYEALRHDDRRKNEFLATLAHELRNPLAPIRNALEIMRLPAVSPDTLERARAMMERQVQHVVRLVDDLLDVSRVMGGKIELRRAPVDLADAIARGVETVQPLLDAQRHQLSIALPSEALWVNADTVRLAQVIGNLLTNAAKYTDPGGRLTLSAERVDGRVVVRVRDNGIGIDPSMRPHIFDLFVQVDQATSRSQGGLGIGLTLARNLIDMHEGTIEVRSAGLGSGTEMVVTLPALGEASPAPGASGLVSAEQVTNRPRARVLIVDDNDDAAESLAWLMRSHGHEVRTALDGPTALEVMAAFTPHIAFLDIGMPGMDGYELAHCVRERPSEHAIVLVALTGWGQPEDRQRSAASGFDHHLVKPLEPDVALTLVASCMSRP